MPLPAGKRLGPYELIAPIGAGGMGEVYRARDPRLNRDVAIKVLPDHLTHDAEALARFEREAKAVAALSHPNILVLHDFDSESGLTWAVTELLEGETLRSRLDRGALPWRKAADFGAAIAEGLAAAHARGITHRDIKPANIFLTSDGRVKILDFGLATEFRQLLPDDKTASHIVPGTGTVSGTIGYMSPEQLRGENAGPASDIFSLGCVLYEMVTGRRAFEGQSATDAMASILKDDPPSVADSGKGSSPEFDRVVERCLAKNPAQRFQSAGDLAFALRSLSSSTGEQKAAPVRPSHPRQRYLWAAAGLLVAVGAAGFEYWHHRGENIDSVAVLPFANASGSADADWLVDGITESLINSLSGLPNLKVMSHSAVFRYKGKDADPRAVGRDLGVRTVLTGRIMERGDHLAVSAELVNASDNSQIWGDVYNRKAMDAMAVQQDIASQIAGKLRARLTSIDKAKMHQGETANPEAYQLYLKGRYYVAKFDPENLRKGFAYFEQAIALDPSYALAYDGLSYYYQLVEELYFPADDVMPKSEQAAQKAIAIDDSIADSHVEAANVKTMYRYDWEGAEREYKRAIELNPNYAPAHEYYSWLLMGVGRTSEALAEIRRAEALDPTSVEVASLPGWWFYLARRYDEAATEFGKCLDLDPAYSTCLLVLGQTRELQGRFDETIALEGRVLKYAPELGWALAATGRAYALSGRRAEAQQTLDKMLAVAKRGVMSKFSIATVYAALGDKSRALDYLEQALAERSFYFDFLKSDPELDSLRPEPRFQELVRRMNFPQ